MRPTSSCSPETGAEIADRVLQLRTGVVRALFLVECVVLIFQVPVIHERHEHSQAVELALTGERIFAPFPVADFLLPLQVSLQANIVHGPIWGDQILTASQAR